MKTNNKKKKDQETKKDNKTKIQKYNIQNTWKPKGV